jgi:hypothetical protein
LKARKDWPPNVALRSGAARPNREGWAGRPVLSGFLTKSLFNILITYLSAAEVFEFNILTLGVGEGVIKTKEDPGPVVIFLLVSDVLGVGSLGGSRSKNFFSSMADVLERGRREGINKL